MPNESRQNFGVRLPMALIAAIKARASLSGQSQTQIVEAAIAAYLGMDEAAEEGHIEQRLTDVEQRLTDVEQRLTENAQQRLTNVKHRPTNAQQTPNDAHEEGHPQADGQQWLSTSQAVEASKARGGPDNRATLLRWAREGKLEPFCLRWIPHGSKRNDLATFEDLGRSL